LLFFARIFTVFDLFPMTVTAVSQVTVRVTTIQLSFDRGANNGNNIRLQAKMYIYVNSSTQRGPNKIIKNILIEDFFHLPPVSLTPVNCEYLREFSKKFETALMGGN
jgi:hypothetical protein